GGVRFRASGRGATACRARSAGNAEVLLRVVTAQERKTFIVALTSSRQTGHSFPTNWPTQWLHMVWPQGTHAVSRSRSRQQGHSFVRTCGNQPVSRHPSSRGGHRATRGPTRPRESQQRLVVRKHNYNES
ncbi:unnamed protein product, partial [Pelagomonas calceolata]